MKHLIVAEQGLLADNQWQAHLSDRPCSLIRQIRKRLPREVPGLTEKFNRNSNYFGYRANGDKDRAYIYVQKKGLRIDLHIKREHEPELIRQGFTIKYVNNYQGRAGWLTGWRIPHNEAHAATVVKWLLQALEEC